MESQNPSPKMNQTFTRPLRKTRIKRTTVKQSSEKTSKEKFLSIFTKLLPDQLPFEVEEGESFASLLNKLNQVRVNPVQDPPLIDESQSPNRKWYYEHQVDIDKQFDLGTWVAVRSGKGVVWSGKEFHDGFGETELMGCFFTRIGFGPILPAEEMHQFGFFFPQFPTYYQEATNCSCHLAPRAQR